MARTLYKLRTALAFVGYFFRTPGKGTAQWD